MFTVETMDGFTFFNVRSSIEEIRKMDKVQRREAFKAAKRAAQKLANEKGFIFSERGIGSVVQHTVLAPCSCR